MITQASVDRNIANIQNAINNKRKRSDHPATVKVAGFINLARTPRIKPADRQKYVENALAELSQVPESDDLQDLAQKIKNEASKDLNASKKSDRMRAIEAVKICDRIIAPEINVWMVEHAGTGIEGILRGSGPKGMLLKEDIRKKLPRSKAETSDKKENPTTEELLLAYAGS